MTEPTQTFTHRYEAQSTNHCTPVPPHIPELLEFLTNISLDKILCSFFTELWVHIRASIGYVVFENIHVLKRYKGMYKKTMLQTDNNN